MNLALIGGEEFADGFEDVHADLLATAGGARSRGVFLVTAAAEDGTTVINYWRELSVRRLSVGGATVSAPPVIDSASANDAANVRLIDEADWLYLGGGKPHVALGILHNSAVQDAILRAAQAGKLILGASAGAMMMCAQSVVLTDAALATFQRALRNPVEGQTPSLPPVTCLGLVPKCLCAPHFERSYARQMEIGFRTVGLTILGIDEQTAMHTVDGEHWLVRGRARIVVIPPQHEPHTYHAGMEFTLPAG